jgi:hypothetical protein
MIPNRLKVTLFLLGGFLVYLLFAKFLYGLTSPLGITVFAIIEYLGIVIPLLIMGKITDKISFIKASKLELKAEDDITLQSIAFSQADYGSTCLYCQFQVL